MEMKAGVNLAFKVISSGLLMYAAAEDLRSRKVPYLAGIGMLLLGAAALLWEQHWLLVLFYFSAVIGSRGGAWGLLPVGLGLSTLAVPGLMEDAFPFVVAILFVNVLFGFSAIGEGDAVLAYGLLGAAYESGLWMPLALLATGLLGVVPLVWRRSPSQVLARAGEILRNFEGIEEDQEAYLFPWAVLAAAVGLVYLWGAGGGPWQ